MNEHKLNHYDLKSVDIDGIKYFGETQAAQMLWLKPSTAHNSMSLLYRAELLSYLQHGRRKLIPADQVEKLIGRLEDRLKTSSAMDLARASRLNGIIVVNLLTG